MKRTHRKVRTGCDTCRLRRIKCDELRPICTPCQRLAANHAGRDSQCSFVTADQATDANGLHNTLIERLASVTNVLSPVDPSTSLAASEYGWPEHLSDMDKRLLHHACTVNSDLSAIVQSGHVTGLAQFSKYLVMARSCHHVRHAMCGVAAAHLCALTHSTEISKVEVEKRMLAMRAMGRELRIKHLGRFESNDYCLEEMIASSTLLGWNAPCGNEYAVLLKGIIALKTELHTVTTVLAPASEANLPDGHTHNQCPSNTEQLAQISDDMLLDALDRSAQCLKKCSPDKELMAGVLELQCFIHNIGRLLRSQHSLEDQLSASWPIRNWLRVVPNGHARLAAEDPLVLLYLANYDMVMLAVCKRLPQLGVGLSVDDRAESVVRMHKVIDEHALGIKGDLSRDESEVREEQKRLLARQALDHSWDICSKSLANWSEKM